MLLKLGPLPFELLMRKLELGPRLFDGSARIFSLMDLSSGLGKLGVHHLECFVLPLELSLRLRKGRVSQRELSLRSLASGALLLNLALHRHHRVTLLLEGGGEPLNLLSPLLSLRKARLRVLQRHVPTFSMSLCLGKAVSLRTS